MQRAFSYIAIGAAPQPMISTTLAAAVNPTTVPDNTQQTTLQVANSAIFIDNDFVTIGLVQAGLFINRERVQIVNIPDGTHITVQGLTMSHAVNEFVILAIAIAMATVQAKDGNTGDIGIGTGPSLALATGAQMVYKLSKVAAGTQPNAWDMPTGSPNFNTQMSSDLWIAGTAADTYLPSLTIV